MKDTHGLTYDLRLIESGHRKWSNSCALRQVYGACFSAMEQQAAKGPALELGSGIGAMKRVVPDLVTSDIIQTPYVDIVASAYDLDALQRRWATVYAFDVLHHLREPFTFFASAARVLKPGGRIVILEPAATLSGRWFYKMFHHEPMRIHQLHAPYVFPSDDESGAFANMGLGWVLFVRDRAMVESKLADMGLQLMTVRFRDGLAYAATGGFSAPQLLPTWLIRFLLKIEKCLPQSCWQYLGLRMMIVLEKKNE